MSYLLVPCAIQIGKINNMDQTSQLTYAMPYIPQIQLPNPNPLAGIKLVLLLLSLQLGSAKSHNIVMLIC